MRYILGIDIGTTAIKAAVIGEDGKVYGEETCEYALTTLPTGEVEADLQLYIDAFAGAIRGAVKNSKADKKDIKCVGFSSTAETCVFLDADNQPLCKVIAWMDTRGTKEAEYLSEHFDKEDIISKVGFDNIYAIHPISKILAVKNKYPEVFANTKMFAQIKDYFVYVLSGKFITEHSVASDHGFFDITNRCYWQEMLDFVGIDKKYLPELTEPGLEIGKITEEAAEIFGLDPDTMINVGAFDQACGAIGAGNIKPGIASESTGSALVTVATINELSPDSKGDVPTLCRDSGGGEIYHTGHIGGAGADGEQQFPDFGRFCGVHGNLCVSAVSAWHGDAVPGEIYGGQSGRQRQDGGDFGRVQYHRQHYRYVPAHFRDDSGSGHIGDFPYFFRHTAGVGACLFHLPESEEGGLRGGGSALWGVQYFGAFRQLCFLGKQPAV